MPLWIKRRCAKSEICRRKKVIFYVYPNNVLLNFTEFKEYIKVREFY